MKPGFFKNEQLAEVPYAGRLLFAGLWLLADKEGRLEDRPKRIKAELFPWDDVKVDDLLTDLTERGFITRYQVEAVAVIQIVHFRKHQNPHHREAESVLPENPNKNTKPSNYAASHGKAGTSRAVSTSDSDSVSDSGSTSEGAESASGSPPEVSPTVLMFPCQGMPQSWALTEAQLSEWVSLYRPGMDIEGECRKALAWVLAKPGHRKTAGGMARFLVGWLNRVVDRGVPNVDRVPEVARIVRRLEPTAYDTWACPHTPQCDDGQWQCHRRTERAAFMAREAAKA